MDIEYTTQSQRSSEEEDELNRSVKKFKESNGARSFLQPRNLVSYKDCLVGDIPGAYEKAFKFDRTGEEDYKSNAELEPLTEGMAEVRLTKETKARIRAPWSKALIVKVFGRSVGFHYLTFKINALWKPVEKMDCVNLGRGFFLIRFSSTDDYDKVLRGGPWLIGGHFLAIKQWEPYFKASEAKLTSIAAWVRLPKLPIEFYDTSVLKEIGSVIGPVLRIDSYTTSETRGGYARLCVQIDLEKPFINSIRPVKEGDGQVSPLANETNETSEEAQSDPKYGPWMVVTRRRNANKVGRASRPTNTNKSNQAVQIKVKGSSVLSQSHALKAEAEYLEESNPSDSANSSAKTTRVAAAHIPQQILRMENDCVMKECKDISNKNYLQGPRQHFEGKVKALVENKFKGNKGLEIKSTKNLKSSKSQLRLTFSSGDKGS
nr:hypothetical protein CFP56_76266 [Quercus suber]